MFEKWLVLLALARADFPYTDVYAAARSDYYLRSAVRAPAGSQRCRRLVDAAVDASPRNETVAKRASGVGCAAEGRPRGAAALQLGPTRSWGPELEAAPECATPAGVQSKELFPTPLGFVHVSELGLRDWQRTLNLFRDASISRFKSEYERATKGAADGKFMRVNNAFFKRQRTNPQDAIKHAKDWKKMYGSPEYKEYADAALRICSSYLRTLGVPLSVAEEAGLETVLWAAVYPNLGADVVTHLYHAHQESIVSFVLYVSNPAPATPMTVADPRGAPPIEDYEWFQNLGDLGVDAEPPFHRTVEFFPGDGDIFIFPSYAIHKVPPHHGDGTRVAWSCNCHLPKHHVAGGAENPLDGWERIARWPSGTGPRAGAAAAYLAHAQASLAAAHEADDPYMKLWEAQNQVVAMLQFAPSDAQMWLDAGNVSAHIAILLASRDEGNYFPDAVTFWTRALHLDASAKGRLTDILDQMLPEQPPHGLEDGYAAASRVVKAVRSWKAPPAKHEFIQFLHEAVNGPGMCKRMCPSSARPSIPGILIKKVFATRIFTLSLHGARSERERLVEVAAELLGAQCTLEPVQRSEECWLRNETASLSATVCDSPAQVWFADPRGVWLEQWPGAVKHDPEAARTTCRGLAAEPKAPFHWHGAADCKKGEALLFPAWLAYKVAPGGKSAVRSFEVSVRLPGGPAGWRLPVLRPLCQGAGGAEQAQAIGRASKRKEDL